MCSICSIDNTAPAISGPNVVNATRGERLEETFTAEDADGHEIITFELVEVSKHCSPQYRNKILCFSCVHS